MGNKTSLNSIIRQIEDDTDITSQIGEDRLLSSGLLNDLGALMETSEGKTWVEVRLKDKAGTDSEKQEVFRKLYHYVEKIDRLNISRAAKGYLIRKLNPIATIKIKREEE